MPKPEKSLELLKKYLDKHQPPVWINKPPHDELGITVVIPSYREGRLIKKTLLSLTECFGPQSVVEVIVVLNAAENASDAIIQEQEECRKEIEQFINNGLPEWLQIHIITAYNLRPKHFGAGLARKTGLDEAVRRHFQLKLPHGIITCLDADSPVAPDYFKAIEEWFENPRHQGAIIYFEHPLEGNAYPEPVYEAITLYELHLRYYLLALKQTGFPYAFHTIGSCMAFRTLKYVQTGGMPKKQAGEDFYFLQKLIPLGGFGEIHNTTVFPSPRPSDRVIFGTGASIKQHVEGTRKQGTTYNPQAFEDLKNLFLKAEDLMHIAPENFEEWTYNLTGPLRSFLLNSDFKKEIINIQQNSANKKTFLKRFFDVFNAFRVVKYLNYSHEYFYARSNLFEAAIATIEHETADTVEILDEKELLLKYREFEKRTAESKLNQKR